MNKPDNNFTGEFKISRISNSLTSTLNIYYIDGTHLAVAETSKIPNEEYDSPYYFNRLFVPKELRNKGIAKELLRRLCEEADTHCINILCHVNPYDSIDDTILLKLYKSVGFKETKNKQELFRYHKVRG